MTQRDRAWRRRKAKAALRQTESHHPWLSTSEPSPLIHGRRKLPLSEAKVHRHGGLTHVQTKRLEVGMMIEARDLALTTSFVEEARVA